MTLYGWDASDFDWPRGQMDLAAARADGISFFTHKATESTNPDWNHVHYGEVMNRAQAAGIPFLGAYHVVRTGDINAQVDYFLAYVNTQTPWWKTFPGWFFQSDLEKWDYDAVAPALGVAFAAEVERRTGRRCLLYAPEWAYGDSIGGSAPLWASAYGNNPAGPYRSLYPGDGNTSAWQAYSGRVPVVLQFGSRATIGSQPGCDINAFRGTPTDFAQLIGGIVDMPLDDADKQWFIQIIGEATHPNTPSLRNYVRDQVATVAKMIPTAAQIVAAIKADPPAGVNLTDAQIQQLAATIAVASAPPNFTVTLTGDAKPAT